METVASRFEKPEGIMLTLVKEPDPPIIGELLVEPDNEKSGQEFLLQGDFQMLSAFYPVENDEFLRAELRSGDGRVFEARNLAPRDGGRIHSREEAKEYGEKMRWTDAR